MLASSALYRSALLRPHQRYFRVELWRAGVQLDPASGLPATTPVPYFSGSVRASLTSRVTRTLTLVLHERYYPWDATDPFNPFGDEIRVFAGIRFGDSYVEAFPVFTGRVSKPVYSDNGTFQLSANDLAAEVAAAGFASPANSQVGSNVVDEFKRLVSDGFPDALFGTCDTFGETVPTLTYDGDRGKALDDVAAAAGAFWYTLGNGRFVLRRIPWLQQLTPVRTLTDGEGGLLTKIAPSRDRANVFNSWTLVADRTDGGAPIFATVEDIDATSPLYVLGPFGRKSKTVRIQGATTQGQLVGLGQEYVARSRALAQAWSADMVPDASMELGDTVTTVATRARGKPRQTVQVVSGFTFPLTVGGTMPLELRSQEVAFPVKNAGTLARSFAYRKATTIANGAASSSSFNTAAPSDLVVGDSMYTIVAVAGSTAITGVPAGWTLVGTVANGTVLTVSAYRKTAVKADLAASYAWTLAGVDEWSAAVVAGAGQGFASAYTVTQLDAQQQAETVSQVTHPAPLVIGTGAQNVLLTIWARATISGSWVGPPAGDVTLAQVRGAHATNNNVALLVAGSKIVPAGKYARTADTDVAAANVTMGSIMLGVTKT